MRLTRGNNKIKDVRTKFIGVFTTNAPINANKTQPFVKNFFTFIFIILYLLFGSQALNYLF